MAKAYYSTVFQQPAEAVWEIIRDFNNYPVWVGGAGESRIEEGKSGDAVGAVRNAQYRGRTIRQRLLGAVRRRTHSDLWVLRSGLVAGRGLRGHLARHADRRRRSFLCRMVGEFRL